MIDPTNRNTALATALVEELARNGVRRAILSPGSRSSPIALALDREPGIELTVVLDERSAGFVALGCAVASGVATVVACTSGSAAANLHPAIVEADQAGVPLIVLTSDRPPELRGIGAGQTIDQIGLYGGAVRWFCEAGTHGADDAGLLHMRALGCRAWGEAIGGRGPVHLNLSWRDPLGPEPAPGEVTATRDLARDGRPEGRPLTTPILSRRPNGEIVGALAGAVARAERGLIVAGRDTAAELPGAVLALAEATGFPVLADPTSGLRLGPGGDAIVGAYDLIARSQPRSLAPDLILRFGDMPTSKPLRAWIEALAVDQIAVDPPGRWNEPTRFAVSLVRADAVAVAQSLAGRVESPVADAWGRSWREAELAAQAAIDGVLADVAEPTEPGIWRALGEAFAAGDDVFIGSSMPIRDAEAFLRPRAADVRLYANRGANGIDGLVSSACGVALGGRRPTWLVLGDLALAHDLGGFAAVAATEVALRIVVIDNGGGGIFDFLPQAQQVEAAAFERLFTTPSGLDLEPAAASFGLRYREIASAAELSALAAAGTVLARVAVDRSDNVALHRRIADAASGALD